MPAYAADVPLICDPVPGGWREVIIPIGPREAVSYLLRWDDAIPTDPLEWYERRMTGRAEWPDAEFCAA